LLQIADLPFVEFFTSQMLLYASKNHASTACFPTRLSLSTAKFSSFSSIVAQFPLQALACQKNSIKATH